MSNVQPIVISPALVSRSLSNPDFFNQVPEFRQLKPKVAAMRVNLSAKGCAGCKQTRVENNLFRDFTVVVQALSSDGVRRLKQYFNAGKLMLNTRNAQTNRIEIKVL